MITVIKTTSKQRIAFEEQLGVAILRVPELARPVKTRAAAAAPRDSSDLRAHAPVQDVMNIDSDIDMPHTEQIEGALYKRAQ